ncbi:MAG: hypothetical protein NC311_04050 [Muribaculaceae bacterium]|nr:hypothetical protein [Muribaculaceae bacterium]
MMLPLSVRKFFGNLVGSFIANGQTRRRVRVNITAPLGRCMRFVRRTHGRRARIEKFYGAGGKSLVLGVNKKYAYKFSCMHKANAIARREYDIVKYFRDISPFFTPDVELVQNGRDIIRRYDYISGGTALSHLPVDVIIKNANKIGKQIGAFLFEVSRHDPDCLKKYKQYPVDIPRPFYGWNHEDWNNLENFIIDPKTFKIMAVIDWENAKFGNFYWRLYRHPNPEKRAIFAVAEREYMRLYNAEHKS